MDALSIMSKKIAKKRLFCLFPIGIILFIAIGLSLVHPLLHLPSDDDHHLTHHCAHHHGGTHDDDQASECPVCYFLSTSQLLTWESAYNNPTKIHLEPLAQVYFLPETDTDVKQVKPRAPPELAYPTKL
ncbi:MAG: hypothetical protein PVJ84_06410 [Desulfobacteraceae bacterium]